MHDLIETSHDSPRVPWNKGKLLGPKPALRHKHVWSIRARLQLEGRIRDLAMFNQAIEKWREHLSVGRRGHALSWSGLQPLPVTRPTGESPAVTEASAVVPRIWHINREMAAPPFLPNRGS
jgi:hypothetical protein